MHVNAKETDATWRAELSPEQGRVARLKGMGRRFTAAYDNSKADGTYGCV